MTSDHPVDDAPIDEAVLLKRARETFRFGSDGRLVAPDGGSAPAGSAREPSAATLEAARAYVSDDPVLDECFEVALVFEAMANFGRSATAESGHAPVDAPAADDLPVAVDEDQTALPVALVSAEAPAVADGPDEASPIAAPVEVPVADQGLGAAAEEPDPFVEVIRDLREDITAEMLGASTAPLFHAAASSVATGTGDGLVADRRVEPAADLAGFGPVGPPRPADARVARAGGGGAARRSPQRTPRPGRHPGVGARHDARGPVGVRADPRRRRCTHGPVPLAVGIALWTNAALDEWLRSGRPGDRTLVAVLDEWSQAHFLVRILPELLRRGRWRGQLQFAAASGRAETMVITLVAHEDDQGGTDAVSLFAMPLAPTSPGPTPLASPAPATAASPVTSPSSGAVAGSSAGTVNGVRNGALGAEPDGGDPLAAVGSGGHDGIVSPASDQLFSALVQHISDLIVVTDEHGRITFASPGAQALLDLAPASDGVRPNLLAIMHPDNRPTTLAALARQPDQAALPPHPMRVLGVDGTWRDLSGVLTDLTAAPAVGGYVLNARDVTEMVRAEQSITDQAYTDALTGLANRVRLLDRLEGNAHSLPPAPCALVVLGLDHLRRIDAEHGTIGVEAVLSAVGLRLARTASDLGREVVAARLHSDEFALLLPGTDEVGAAVAAAGQIRLALREPIRLGDQNVTVTASMGVATSVSATADDGFDEILARADLAMREAKARGRDRTVTYDERLGHRQQHRRGIDQQLRRAIDSDGLRIQFQPIVELASGRIVAAEALLRVRGEDGELLSPGAFVEAAESNGLISRLGAAVLRTTCEQATALDLKPGGFPISVNVSPRQIADPGFARRVLTILDETGLAPDRLNLEITEGAFVGRDDASETNIISLRDEGVRLGLDEFGGDASLGYLRRFPLDFVKIDRRLIAGLGANYVDGTIVRATIELAHKLGLLTVAVGVEHEEQQRRLEQLGCDRAQGYLFGGAVTSVELSAMVHGRG